MPQAVVNLSEYSDRVLNVIKAKFGFKRKDEALNYVVSEYGEQLLERELKPEFVERINRISKEKPIKVDNFAKHFGLE